MDMWRPYFDAAQLVLPHAQVVIDHFHVVKMANECLETIRKAIKAELSEPQRKGLMHDRYILLHRFADLDELKRLILETWTENFPSLKIPDAEYLLIEADPETFLLQQERLVHLHHLPKRLDPAKRELLALRFSAGLSSTEIALVVGKSQAAVKKQLTRILQELKEHMA